MIPALDDTPSVEAEIRRLIARAGPMPVAEYMALCLTHAKHGYYMTRDPLGALGDFTTAPEISQMFGEIIGLWSVTVWRMMGAPDGIMLVELGPGRGTMMRDALRAARLAPDFRRQTSVHMVEISPALQRIQETNVGSLDVPVHWHRSLEEVPHGPMIVLANEFLDALPVEQAVKQADGWHQRLVGVDADGKFVFQIAPDPLPAFDVLLPRRAREADIGSIFEWRSDHFMFELGRRVAGNRGAALIFDYGHVESAVGETLQAVGEHDFADPLSAPGEVDITAHVDFQAAAKAAESMRAQVHGPVQQGEFLRRLGIEERAAALQAGASPEKATEVRLALERLTGEGATGMGRLFKVMGLSYRELGALPGFGA